VHSRHATTLRRFGLTAFRVISNGQSPWACDKSWLLFLYQPARIRSYYLCLMTASSDAIFRELPEQRGTTQQNHAITSSRSPAVFGGRTTGAWYRPRFAAMFPFPRHIRMDTSGRFSSRVPSRFRLVRSSAVVRRSDRRPRARSAWIAQREPRGAATLARARSSLRLSNVHLDADTRFRFCSASGSNHPD